LVYHTQIGLDATDIMLTRFDPASILVVDCAGNDPAGLVDMLGQGGYGQVQGMAGIPGALRDLRPDVLILNDLPDPPAATEILDWVESVQGEHGPQVLVLTSSLDRDLRMDALRRGIRDYITLPWEIGELQPRLQHAVENQTLLRRLIQQNLSLEAMLSERTIRLQEAVDVLRVAEKRLADQLARSEAESRSKSELMASAAHELRTPLHAIIGFAELLGTEAHGKLGDPRYREYAMDVLQAAGHLLSMVNGTLDLAKAESGQEPLEFRTVDIGRTVQDSIRLLRQLADGSGVRLQVNVPDIPLMIRTDPEKIRQIVVNLASNAIKFTPRDGQVTVEVSGDLESGAVIMVVRDTGIGMASHDIPTALKPFGQIRRPNQHHPKGTGLGLPLTRRFVEMLGGTLELASQPGRGTVVTVRLPTDPGVVQRNDAPRAAAV